MAENKPEQEFVKQNKSSHRNGWPDFAFFKKNGKFKRVVEVKRFNGEPLQPWQEKILLAFHNSGIPAYVWTPSDGFCLAVKYVETSKHRRRYSGTNHANQPMTMGELREILAEMVKPKITLTNLSKQSGIDITNLSAFLNERKSLPESKLKTLDACLDKALLDYEFSGK